MKEIDNEKRIRCKYCNSCFFYYKIRDQKYQCRSCGKLFDFNEDEKIKKEE